MSESISEASDAMAVALLTGGDDKSYALGLTQALTERRIRVEVIGSTYLDDPGFRVPGVTFRNLRGDQSENAKWSQKAIRIAKYYVRLIRYAVGAEPKIFHILWNNKYEWLDRTALMCWYKLFGRKLVFTAHNINARRRDGADSWWNRWTLWVQYRLTDHVIVHTQGMRDELVRDFGVTPARISISPFGLNTVFPVSEMTAVQARNAIGIPTDAKVLLFFGQIAPYKGLEILVSALEVVRARESDVHLVIAGKVKPGHAEYWSAVRGKIAEAGLAHCVTTNIGFIPDDEVERYFKAADVVVLPYLSIFQSGIPFLAFGFGLPVVATKVGGLSDVVIEDVTGFLAKPGDAADLAEALKRFFESGLCGDENRRRDLARRARQELSWTRAAEVVEGVYLQLRGL